jgi:hypothetical protein
MENSSWGFLGADLTGGSGLNWYGVVNTLGGHWYSTPTQGECKNGATLGTDGCTWKLVAAKKYVNESCVNANVDRVIEQVCAHSASRCESTASFYDQFVLVLGGSTTPSASMRARTTGRV